ncbi:MAG TPA: T9SS type A sorting domain-containing protein [Bacteroidia bacterium]|jgi:PKD repeat protein|nr:T9SS type A sorting domain-containing protein [Bacteroidia bacterium]
MKKLLLIALLLCIKQLNAQCSLSITGDTIICSGTTTTLTASGATNYTWMPSSAHTATIAVTPTATIIYTVTGTTGTCTATNTVTITINPTPTMVAMADQGWCQGAYTTPVNFATIPASPASTYSWYFNPYSGTSNPLPSLMTQNTGLTTLSTVVSVTPTLNGCVGPPSGFTIFVYPSPIAKFSASMHVCDGQAMQFTDFSMPNTGSITVNQWAWDMDGNGSIDASTQNPNYIYPTGSVGTNTVILYIATSSVPSCTAQVTAPVYINPNPVANFVGDSLHSCSDLYTNFTNLTTVMPLATGLSYTWTLGNGNTSTMQNPPQQTYTNASTTQNVYYSVSLTVRSDSTCINAVTKTNYIEVLACASNGIEKYSGSNEANIYPNPSNGNFIIETNLSEKQTVQILDVTGKLILQQTINSKTIIDASSLDNGIYFVQINTSDGLFTKKIIVQH